MPCSMPSVISFRRSLLEVVFSAILLLLSWRVNMKKDASAQAIGLPMQRRTRYSDLERLPLLGGLICADLALSLSA